MKKVLFFATVLIALYSCTSNDYVGDQNLLNNNENGAISFNSNSGAITRAAGAAAAEKLNNNFVVEGFKTVSSSGYEVFDNYNVNWKENTAGTTTSNSANWEYVGETKHANSAASEQTIKYWDFAASQYDFWAYSLGGGSATVTELVPTTTALANSAYAITGSKENLAKVYISDLVTAYNPVKSVSGVPSGKTEPATMGNQVNLNFRSLVTKVRMGIYETIPGYSVRNVQFYPAADGTPESTATLYAASSVLPAIAGGTATYKVTFPTRGASNIGNSDYNKAHVAITSSGNDSKVTFGGLSYGAHETGKHEKTGYTADPSETWTEIWVQRSASTVTWAKESGANAGDYSIVLPYETGAVLTLKVDYTLESIDGTGETITVHGATALIPSQFTQWKANYAYTYLFKISDNTNGLTNTSVTDKEGLYPITLDAVVTATEDGTQETITTVSTPSITTYSITSNVVTNNEYTTSDVIYATATEDGSLITMTSTTAWLYSLSGKTNYTEADVLAAITKYKSNTSGTIVGRNSITLTSQTISLSETELPLVDGNKITDLTEGQIAKFTCGTAGTYAFVYQKTAGSTADKYEAVTPANDTDLTSLGYYSRTGTEGNYTYTEVTSGTGDGTTVYYDKYTEVTGATYAVKVIKVN